MTGDDGPHDERSTTTQGADSDTPDGTSTPAGATARTAMAGETSADDAFAPDATVPAPTTRDELLRRAARYARTVPLDVDHAAVDWELSERAVRRAGACRYDATDDRVTIRLTWAAYRAYGWPAFAAVVRHELVHAWEFQQYGESGHGPRFRRVADSVDAPRHCEPFTEPRLRLVCTAADCEWTAGRHRASVVVTHPERRRCGDCGAPYAVEHVASGERWRSHAGYQAARERIDDW